jgi:hypothetical protein
MIVKPYLIIPNLIRQPTWGGSYIVNYKNIQLPEIVKEKIGQSYELYEASKLSTQSSLEITPALELSNPQNPEKSQKFYNGESAFSIKELIDKNPTQILGAKYVKKIGKKIKTLIKLNQGRGNSYQIHVGQPQGKWLAKPESWFFLENGLVTLGAKQGIDWKRYEPVCLQIDNLTTKLGEKVKSGQLSLESAKEELQSFINKNNPLQFVNLLTVKQGQAVDLSEGGIHHSWEEDDEICPQGNIVYEVQENVYDDASTIRSFDKGKIKDDGSSRNLQIADYFRYVNRNPQDNDPQKHLVKPRNVTETETSVVKQIFSTARYALQEIEFSQKYEDQTSHSFHHLFVKSGVVELVADETKLTLTPGFSVFVPAAVGSYQVSSKAQAVILKTYL